MFSIGLQEILLRQERARVERLSRDAWKRHAIVGAATRPKGRHNATSQS